MSLSTWEALVSRLSYVASVPLWSRRTSWTGWSRDAHGSRRSWAPGNTWYTWSAKRSTITTRSIWWRWLSALCQKKKKKKKNEKKTCAGRYMATFLVKINCHKFIFLRIEVSGNLPSVSSFQWISPSPFSSGMTLTDTIRRNDDNINVGIYLQRINLPCNH